jgi:glucan biosynthesis protein C
MPVMFFVAGYFGISSLARKGQYSFWKDKINRIIIPWGLGVIFLAPAIGYMHSLSRNLYPAYLSYWLHYFFGKEYQNYGQVHFYFLGTLTLYYLALSLAYRIHKPLGKVSDKPPGASCGFFILLGLVTGLIFFCGNLVINEGIWAKIGIFDFPATRFLPYMGYFFLGVFAYKQQWFTASGYTPKLKWWLPMCVVFFILCLSLLDKRLGPGKIGMFCYALSYFFFCLTAVFSLLTFFQKRLNFTTSLLSSLSVNSYAIYFLHYFFILWIILALRTFLSNAFIKWLLVGVISNIISYFVARYALSKTPMFRTRVRLT